MHMHMSIHTYIYPRTCCFWQFFQVELRTKQSVSQPETLWGFLEDLKQVRMKTQDARLRSGCWLWIDVAISGCSLLGGGFDFFLFSPLFGEDSILTNIFQLGWNHQLVYFGIMFFNEGEQHKNTCFFKGSCCLTSTSTWEGCFVPALFAGQVSQSWGDQFDQDAMWPAAGFLVGDTWRSSKDSRSRTCATKTAPPIDCEKQMVYFAGN